MMNESGAVAIVGLGAILPDAPSVQTFWQNIQSKRYSIKEVPPERWRSELYYDPDPAAPDKTYSKIGAWIDNFEFEPLRWGIPIPPNVLNVMDYSQKWGIAAARQALVDYGFPQRSLEPDRVAVILGSALSGENHYLTSLRIHIPDFLDSLQHVTAFQSLPAETQQALLSGLSQQVSHKIAAITEDTMPGELGNVIAGRIANVFNFTGPNFVTDAACASSHAAMQAAVNGLLSHQFDAVLTGGVDHNMGIEGFVKFSKIGALSPDGSRPFADGANGFVMGEGAAIFLLKRLEDAEQNDDPIYAVIRGIGASSDGRGKGITAPNPLGQLRAIERAWKSAGVDPASAGLIEAHGTSTRVGDVVEAESLNRLFGPLNLPRHSIALGSVKSNIGHLKSAAGAAGLLKTVLALHHKVLPASINFERPNPNIPFETLPFYVNTEMRPWERREGQIRRAGLSAFGFGGTNFHMVVEEWVPGLLTKAENVFPAVQPKTAVLSTSAVESVNYDGQKLPYRGIYVISAANGALLADKLRRDLDNLAGTGFEPGKFPAAADILQPERLVIDFGTPDELKSRMLKALQAFESKSPAAWQAMMAQGVYRGSGKAGKTAFLFPGQGSQYLNMLKDLCEHEPIAASTFAEADQIMRPLLGRTLSSYIFTDAEGDEQRAAEEALRDTAITQPAMLTANVALLRLLKAFGYEPDLVIGHSLGEYAALVAAGVLEFHEALEIVSARGREMKKVSVADNGGMVAVSAPLADVQKIVAEISEYVVIANINSPLQCVVGGSTAGIHAALQAFEQAGFQATQIPVSHAFHTKIVEPAAEPLKQVIARMSLRSPRIPVVANVTGQLYPQDRDQILDLLGRQVASPVQFIRGVETLYAEGVRTFVEVGPKRVLNSLASDILKPKTDVTILATNHPRKGSLTSFNEALCGLLAAGVIPGGNSGQASALSAVEMTGRDTLAVPAVAEASLSGKGISGSVVISGAGLGLPGKNLPVFADDNIDRILNGEIRIEALPPDLRQEMLARHITRVEKSAGGAQMLNVDHMDLTVKLGGQRGAFDLSNDFGVPEERVTACDITTQLAIAAGIEALRDAGIPLVMRYRQTSKGTYLPDRWKLPESLADETGVIFGSAFPGVDQMANEAERYARFYRLTSLRTELEQILGITPADQIQLRQNLQERIQTVKDQLDQDPYQFDRRFIFRVLSMGHAQFAEYIGARGPNTAINAACATTTQALALAEDWIRSGRARRVVVIAGDDVTSGTAAPWITSGLLASGAATLEGDLRQAVLPFDRRRNGMIMGMGAAALVVEAQDAVNERGMVGLSEILATQIGNSAFHGTRLDVKHVSEMMEAVIQQAESRFDLDRQDMAERMMFMSHETYTPARGGSAAAEIFALRNVFTEAANQIVIANTKGFTGHAMGVGIEDVVAVKALEHGVVPPIANLDEQFEPDPDLGDLNLSRGGAQPVEYALRLGAGFGSQIALAVLRHIPAEHGRIDQEKYQRWLAEAAGYDQAELEIEKRTLRIKDQGAPPKSPHPSAWHFGMLPTQWADFARNQRSADSVSPAEIAPDSAQPGLKPAGIQNDAVRRDEAEVQAFVLAQVSEKTGYPVEMLDPELDLEADLGIDTVKQAELFATIREHYQIERPEDLRLSDYNTLGKVIAFMSAQSSVQTEASGESLSKVSPVENTPALETSARERKETQAAALDEVQAFVLQQVSEKTGYPVEMLDPDLDMEADLGIDTVKQAELFAALREHFGIARREDLRLSDYNTLAKVIAFMRNPAAISQTQVEEEILDAEEPVNESKKTVRIRRCVPVTALRPRLDLCMPTGIELDEQSRVVIISRKSKFYDALARQLKARHAQVERVDPQPKEDFSLTVKHIQENGPVQGVYFLASDEIGAADQLAVQQVTLLYHAMRALQQPEFVVAAVNMGGLLGYSEHDIPNPQDAAISGFIKALVMEWPDLVVGKVVDFPADTANALKAERLIAETLIDNGAVEIGYEGERRFAVTLIEEPAQSADTDLGERPVFIVTGGTGGIAVPIVRDLAEHTHGVFYLLGRTILEEQDRKLAQRVLTDRDQVKQELIEQARQSERHLTPAQIDRQLFVLERAGSAYAAIQAVETAGGQALYLPCDVTLADSVLAMYSQVVAQEGRVDVVIHAAGIERSRKLEKKTLDEVHDTLAIKLSGFTHLRNAFEQTAQWPKVMISFGSVAGRFGNSGHTDYAAANNALVSFSARLQQDHPQTRALVLDWTAWAEVGMASRGTIPRMMELAGIDLLDPQEAAPLVYRELTAKSQGEVLLAGSFGILEKQRRVDGGLDASKATALLRKHRPDNPLFSRISGLDLYAGILIETELDPLQEPFLQDHALNQIPLMPGVMGIEGFSSAAAWVANSISTGAQSYRVTGLSDVRFLAPLKFYRGEPRKLTWKVQMMRTASGYTANLVLESLLALKSRPPESVVHFEGKVFLQPDAPSIQPVTATGPHWNGHLTIPADEIYRLYFHGPAFQVLAGVQRSEVGLLAKVSLPQKKLLHANSADHFLTAPRLIEACLQAAGIWEIGLKDVMALPKSIGSVCLYRVPEPDTQLFAQIRSNAHREGCFDARIVDAAGAVYLDLREYCTAPLPYSLDAETLAPLKRLWAA
jgi:malonyl CoA-acyl carrier protein transacylase